MNIAHAFKMIQPHIIKKVETAPVNIETLKAVFEVISNGFNMTPNDIAKKMRLSHSYVSSVVNKLYAMNKLSRINAKEGMPGRCIYAYTARGDL